MVPKNTPNTAQTSGTQLSPGLGDQIVLVTGASRDIGAAIADALASRGARVLAASRSAPGRAVPSRGQVAAVRLDVTDPNQVEDVFDWIVDQVGAVDALVNNAGVGVFAPVTELSRDDFQRVLNVNLTGAFHCAQRALPLLRDGGGRILQIGSLADHRGFADSAAYAASKYGLRGLSDVLREELRDAGVRVTHVSLGAVATDIWNDRPEFDVRDMLAPADVAAVVADVLSRPLSMSVDELRLMPPRGAL